MATHLELSTLMYSFLHRSLLSLGLNLGKLDSWPIQYRGGFTIYPSNYCAIGQFSNITRLRTPLEYVFSSCNQLSCVALRRRLQLTEICAVALGNPDHQLTLNHSFATGRKRLVGNGYTHIDAYAKITIAQLN